MLELKGIRPTGGRSPTPARLARWPALLLVLGSCFACGSEDELGLAGRTRSTGLRVLLLGLDGATWELLDPLLDSGELPNLSKLLRAGARGSLVPALSGDPELGWVSILTGQTLTASGITALPWDPELDRIRLPLASDRLVVSVFEVLEAAGLRALVLGFDLAWPEASSRSVFVSSEVTGDARLQAIRTTRGSARTLPVELESELRPLMVDGQELTDRDLQELGELPAWFLEESRASLPLLGHAPSYLRHAWANQRNTERVALHLLRQRPFEVVAVELDALAVCHAMWQHLEPDAFTGLGLDPEEGLRGALLELCRHADRFLGRLLDELGSDTIALVVSAYGYRASKDADAGEVPGESFGPIFREPRPASLHLTLTGSPDANGIFLLAGGPVKHGEVSVTQLDLLPTLTALLGIPSSLELPGRIPGALIEAGFLEEHAPEPVASFEPFLRVASGSERR